MLLCQHVHVYTYILCTCVHVSTHTHHAAVVVAAAVLAVAACSSAPLAQRELKSGRERQESQLVDLFGVHGEGIIKEDIST